MNPPHGDSSTAKAWLWLGPNNTDKARGGPFGADCTLDVSGLLQNGQFILAFKSLIGQAQGDYPTAAGGHWTTKKLLDGGWWANQSSTELASTAHNDWGQPCAGGDQVNNPMEGCSITIHLYRKTLQWLASLRAAAPTARGIKHNTPAVVHTSYTTDYNWLPIMIGGCKPVGLFLNILTWRFDYLVFALLRKQLVNS